MLQSESRMLVALVALIVVGGCGGSEFPDTEPVTGTIAYNGSPVEGANVTFSPQGDGHAATGTTDAAGKFSLTTFVADDGARPGTYAVTVSKTEFGDAPTIPAGGETEADMNAMYEALDAAGGGLSKKRGQQVPIDVLPAKYKITDTSDLKAQVIAGDNNFAFELTD